MSKTTKNGKAAKRAAGAVKRAAIYVRVSTEKQAKTKGSDGQEAAEKESPQAQERDCRALAERQGYVVVKVYRDIEKYRVGKKMVEPSGTRADRPGLRAMLADARKGDFDVILSWREDRLYRGYRPMLDVLETIEETGVMIELALEHFDQAMAPVKAWAARMELEAKHDRVMMGVAGRLTEGKAWPAVVPYGHKIEGDGYAVNEDEAQWVKLVWQCYGDELSIFEIRRRLIAGGAKQRETGKYKIPWAIPYIRRMVSANRDYYYTGALDMAWNGIAYILPIPPIVDADTAAKVKARLARYKAYPAGNLKANSLAAGKVFCKTCGRMMHLSSVVYKPTGKRYVYYICPSQSLHYNVPDCAKSVGGPKLDAEVWGKLWELISVPGKLEAAIEKRVTELQAQEFDAEGECDKLTKQLDDLAMKRQEVIAWAQAKIITQADMELRLTSLSFEQAEAERELRDKSLLVGNRAERLMAVARAYREAVVGGAVDLAQEPETEAAAARVFQFKRKMVEGLVKRVDVKVDKTTEVTFELDFSSVALAENLCISDILPCQA